MRLSPFSLSPFSGLLTQLTLGNGLIDATQYNNRLQATQRSLASLWTLTNNYGTTNNTGNVRKQTLTVPGMATTLTSVYSYDLSNRLDMAAEYTSDHTTPACPDASSVWCQDYSYDRWGNRLVADQPQPPAYDTTKNQISGTGWAHDNAGNIIASPGPKTFAYDAENRLKSATSPSVMYTYDGEGRRIKMTAGEIDTYYVYDAAGQLAAQYGGTNPATGRVYLTADHLGSTRVITNATGSVVERTDYLPFGEEITVSQGSPRWGVTGYGNANSVLNLKFTGKERDSETGLDYFGARYFSGAQGRFTTPDPLMASARASNPQTWNRYAYTLNNPLRYVDPDGMDVPAECAKDPNCTIKVKVNVIYDQTANHGKGLTAAQKKGIEQGQIAKAQKDYGTSNIKLDVSYTAGSYTVDQNTGKMQLSGLQSDALNVMVSTGTPNGAAGVSGVDRNTGTAVTFLNVNDVVDTNKAYPFLTNTTEHELAHQFLGHPFLPEPNFLQYFGREMESDARVKGQANGIS